MNLVEMTLRVAGHRSFLVLANKGMLLVSAAEVVAAAAKPVFLNYYAWCLPWFLIVVIGWSSAMLFGYYLDLIRNDVVWFRPRAERIVFNDIVVGAAILFFGCLYIFLLLSRSHSEAALFCFQGMAAGVSVLFWEHPPREEGRYKSEASRQMVLRTLALRPELAGKVGVEFGFRLKLPCGTDLTPDDTTPGTTAD